MRNAAIKLSCLAVRPSAWNNSAPTQQILMKLVPFENLSRKFKFYDNLTRMTVLLQADICTFITSRSFLLGIRNFQTSVSEKIKIHVQKPFPEIRAIYIMWKNYGTFGQARGDNMIRHMFTICWITKTNNTLRIGNTYCFPTTKDTWKTLNITLISPMPLLFFP